MQNHVKIKQNNVEMNIHTQVHHICFKTETKRPLEQTDRQTDGGRWAVAFKPGQQRTRVMLSHSSHTVMIQSREGQGKETAGAGEQR